MLIILKGINIHKKLLRKYEKHILKKRRDIIGNINKNKHLNLHTCNLLSIIAKSRPPISIESRKKMYYK